MHACRYRCIHADADIDIGRHAGSDVAAAGSAINGITNQVQTRPGVRGGGGETYLDPGRGVQGRGEDRIVCATDVDGVWCWDGYMGRRGGRLGGALCHAISYHIIECRAWSAVMRAVSLISLPSSMREEALV